MSWFGYDVAAMFHGGVRAVQIAFYTMAFAAIAPGQAGSTSTSHILSDKEARKAVYSPNEATVPAGMDVTSFTVRVSVGPEGDVKSVANINSLPDNLFAAAKTAALQWHFRTDSGGKKKPRGFEADITFHGPISGTVTTADGKPAVGVDVFGSEWTCCAVKHDEVKTDESGSFRIEHPGEVLHFFAGPDLQPQSRVVTPEMSNVKVKMTEARSSLSLGACDKPQAGFERLGEGKFGLQFDVPPTVVKLVHGKADTDYVVHFVEAKGSHDRIEFWFGPYTMDFMPDDQLFIDSEWFETRSILMTKGAIPGSDGGFAGTDTRGRLRDGRMWRQVTFGAQGPRYFDVSPENAAVFDRIIDSACWITYPKK